MSSSRRSVLIAISAVGLVGQLVVPFFIALAWARVYFTIEGPQREPTSAEVLHYGLLAGIAIGVSVALIVVAQAAHARGLVIAHSVLLVVIIACAILFAVPRFSLSHPHTPEPLPSNYQPCYSGSDKCN